MTIYDFSRPSLRHGSQNLENIVGSPRFCITYFNLWGLLNKYQSKIEYIQENILNKYRRKPSAKRSFFDLLKYPDFF